MSMVYAILANHGRKIWIISSRLSILYRYLSLKIDVFCFCISPFINLNNRRFSFKGETNCSPTLSNSASRSTSLPVDWNWSLVLIKNIPTKKMFSLSLFLPRTSPLKKPSMGNRWLNYQIRTGLSEPFKHLNSTSASTKGSKFTKVSSEFAKSIMAVTVAFWKMLMSRIVTK